MRQGFSPGWPDTVLLPRLRQGCSATAKEELHEEESKKRLLNTEYNILTKLDLQNIEKLESNDLKEEELKKIPDIGDIIAKSIVDYFENSHNKAIIEELKELGLNMNYLGPKIKENIK